MEYSDEFLIHYGLEGMQWGIRRWQYEDGRFNEAGKLRYFGQNSSHRPPSVKELQSNSRQLKKKKKYSNKYEKTYSGITSFGEAKKEHHKQVVRINENAGNEKNKKKELKLENKAFNKKIKELSISEKDRSAVKKVLLITGGVLVSAAAGYALYSYITKDPALNHLSSGTNSWLHSLEKTGAFKGAKCFYLPSDGGSKWAVSNLWNKSWWNNLSSLERTAVEKYTGSAYKDMNKILRMPDSYVAGGSLLNYYKGLINNCTSAMQKASLPNEAVVHRGVGSLSSLAKTLGVPEEMLKNPKLAKNLIGTSYIDPAFGSTGASVYDSWSGCKLHMYLPKGSQAMYVDPVSSVPGEHEILVNRNAKYLVKDILFDNNGTVTDLFVELLEHVAL